jgi:hypothetical protein
MSTFVQALDWAMSTTGTADDAPRALAQHQSAKRLAYLGGSEPALESIPRRQAVVAQKEEWIDKTFEP